MTIEPQRRYSGVTHIYGLVDPHNHQLRYVGKTVLRPARRLVTHKWQARSSTQKRHVLAWLSCLEADGVSPDIVEIEQVPPFGDWEEAERFWISYYRFVGADLCNLTAGGEGAPGVAVSEERRIKLRAKCGSLSPLYGKPKPAHVHEALKAGNERLRADPVRHAAAVATRRAGFTPGTVAGMTARLAAMRGDPEQFAYREKRRKESLVTPEFRAKVGVQSKRLWASKRDEIIAAQNAGKSSRAYLDNQSSLRKKKWTDPDCAYWKVFLTPEKREEIRIFLRRGMKGVEASKKFGLSQSRISQIKMGA